jgi:hypothetical protein
VGLARAALLAPQPDLASVLLELGSAAEEMGSLGPETAPDTAMPELDALRLVLAGVAKLARNGEDFWRGWGRLVGLEPGYTQGGAPVPEQSAARIVVQG